MVLVLLSFLLLLAPNFSVASEIAIRGDSSEISLLIGPDGLAEYKHDYQYLTFSEHRAYVSEGKPIRSDKTGIGLSLNTAKIIYKIRLNKPVAKLGLSFSFLSTKDTEVIVWASQEGKDWVKLFSHNPLTISTNGRVSQSVDISAYQSKDSQPVVYIMFGTQNRPGILFNWSLNAFERSLLSTRPYKPSPVPPNGTLRYAIHYCDINPNLLYLLQNSQVNFLHWHGPFAGYSGIPDRTKLDGIKHDAKTSIDQVHAAGMACILYIAPCSIFGDKEKRTQLFEFYDKYWQQYEDYFGKKPGDLMEMVQRDAQGMPRQFAYKGQKGYHLCVNSLGVRQMTKGLIRMIIETGGDGSFYDGPHVAEGRCYCRWCQDAFRLWLKKTYTAADLYQRFQVKDIDTAALPQSLNDKLWVPFKRFNAWSLTEFLRYTKNYARSLNPNYIMTNNYCMWEGEPFRPIRDTAEDAEMMSQIVDVLFAESKYGAGPYWDGGKISNSSDYRHLLAAAQGIPIALLKTAPAGNTRDANANLTRLAIAEGVANGAAWQIHKLKPAAAQVAQQYGTFLASRQDVLTTCRPWSTMAVWTSATQAYFDASTFPTAVSRYLADNHLPHKFLIDSEVTRGKFEGYEVIIVPEVRVISGKQLAALEAFAKKGGGLVLMGQCGTIDEWGNKRTTLPLEQSAESKVPQQRHCGKGRIAYLPQISLPQSSNNGLRHEYREHLAPLLGMIEWITEQCLPAYVESNNQVEVNIGYDGHRKLIVHLLNYGVDLNGACSLLQICQYVSACRMGILWFPPGRVTALISR
jgi:hypothetical protein